MQPSYPSDDDGAYEEEEDDEYCDPEIYYCDDEESDNWAYEEEEDDDYCDPEIYYCDDEESDNWAYDDEEESTNPMQPSYPSDDDGAYEEEEDDDYCDPEIYYCDDDDESGSWGFNPMQPSYPPGDDRDESNSGDLSIQLSDRFVGNTMTKDEVMFGKKPKKLKTRLFLRWARNQIAREKASLQRL